MNFTCGGCDRAWSGMNMAHCATCHETFGSVRTFDRHRRTGACVAPTGIGLSYNVVRRAWVQPAPDLETQ